MLKFDYHKNYNLKVSKITYLNSIPLGLVNNGNTCFINSILQCLFYTTSLTDYLLNYTVDINKNIADKSLVSLYINLIDTFLTKKTVINPHRIVKCIKEKSENFNNFQQQDSHEFLLFFLETLHNQIKTKVNMNINGNVSDPSDKLMYDSFNVYKKFYEKDYSFVIKNFYGLQYCRLECVCKPRILFEPFVDIVLDLDSSDNLNGLLSEHFGKCTLDKCNECKRNINKTVKLWEPPNNLIITLNRHYFSGETSFSETNSKKLINYPLSLDLTSLVSKDKNDDNNYIYKLYAINYHQGTQNSGHYFSACKNLQDKWYMYDDTDIEHINVMSNLVNKHAYILFYYREVIHN